MKRPDNVSPSQYRVVFPIVNGRVTNKTEQSARIAARIVRERKSSGELVFLSLLRVSEQTPLGEASVDENRLQKARQAVQELERVVEESRIIVSSAVRLVHFKDASIFTILNSDKYSGIFINLQPTSTREPSLTPQTAREITAQTEADVYVWKQKRDMLKIQRIFLAVGGGPNSQLASAATRALALTYSAQVSVFHIYSPDQTDGAREGNESLQRAKSALERVELAETGLLPEGDIAERILNVSQGYDATVLGAPTKDPLKQFVFGEEPKTTDYRTENTVLMVKQVYDNNE